MVTPNPMTYDRLARSTASSIGEGRMKDSMYKNNKLRKIVKNSKKRDGQGGCSRKK